MYNSFYCHIKQNQESRSDMDDPYKVVEIILGKSNALILPRTISFPFKFILE